MLSLCLSHTQVVAQPLCVPQFLSIKYLEMMSTLVSFHGDPARTAEQISWLAFRHIRYNVKPQHAKVMGDAVVETLKRAVGEEWTADMEAAWHELWTKTSDMMIKIIGVCLSNVCAMMHRDTCSAMLSDAHVREDCARHLRDFVGVPFQKCVHHLMCCSVQSSCVLTQPKAQGRPRRALKVAAC